MRAPHLEWVLEEWRRTGIEVTVVGDHTLEITGDSEQDIDQVALIIKEHKEELIAYLIDGDGGQPGEGWPDDRSRDPIPSVCQSCPRLELVDRGDEVMAGCLYECSDDSLSFGWRRFPVGSKGCI